MVIIICILIVILVISGISAAMYLEYRGFNKGTCPKCGRPLRWFDTDSQGGRGYCCNKCKYYTWVSYNSVDKNYKNYYD